MKSPDQTQAAASEDFLEEVFIPKAAAAAAEVSAGILHKGSDSSMNTGRAICEFADKLQPAALVLMKQNKAPVSHFFRGSLSTAASTPMCLSSLCQLESWQCSCYLKGVP